MTHEGKTARRRVRELEGVVRSNRMAKTIVVEVSRQVLHPVLKKYVRRTKRYLAHDEREEAQVGDTVRIAETRPLSARKRFRLVRIVARPALRQDEAVGDETGATGEASS